MLAAKQSTMLNRFPALKNVVTSGVDERLTHLPTSSVLAVRSFFVSIQLLKDLLKLLEDILEAYKDLLKDLLKAVKDLLEAPEQLLGRFQNLIQPLNDLLKHLSHSRTSLGL